MKTIVLTVLATLSTVLIMLSAIVVYEMDHLPRVYACERIAA